MALLIYEMGHKTNGAAPARRVPWVAEQSQAVSGSSQASAPFTKSTRFVTVYAEEDCRVAFGEAPTAVATSLPMVAGESLDFEVMPEHRVAVISA